MRKETIEDATLYLGNCLEIMPTLDMVDHIIADPPYEIEAHNKGRRLLGKKINGKRTVEYGALPFSAITQIDRELVCINTANLCNGWFLAFCQAEAVAAWRDSMEDHNIAYKRAMIWVKPDGAPQFTGDRPGMGYESIVAGWCGNGKSVWNGGGKHGVFTIPKHDPEYGHGGKMADHPTKKPIALMRTLVSLFTSHGDTILDPFMGSGTTGVACAKLGRKFIGCEMDEKYFDISCRNIENAYRQREMFPISIEHLKPEKTGFL